MSHLSPSQKKAIVERQKPIRHAMDRLIERHMPEADDKYAEMVIGMMTKLCEFRMQHGMGRTTKIINIEKANSVIIELDIYENVSPILVCYDPMANRIRTVLPREKT